MKPAFKYTLDENNIGSSLKDLFVEERDSYEDDDDYQNEEEEEEMIVQAQYAGGSYNDRNSDDFGDVWAGALTAVSGTVGKFAATGKKARQSSQSLAEEATKQKQIDAQSLLELQRQKEKASSKSRKIWIWSFVALVVFGIIGFLGYQAFKSK
jgi:hypothetical protein